MISVLTLGFGPQYLAYFVSTTCWPTVHELNLNGPVPVGWLNAYDPVG